MKIDRADDAVRNLSCPSFEKTLQRVVARRKQRLAGQVRAFRPAGVSLSRARTKMELEADLLIQGRRQGLALDETLIRHRTEELTVQEWVAQVATRAARASDEALTDPSVPVFDGHLAAQTALTPQAPAVVRTPTPLPAASSSLAHQLVVHVEALLKRSRPTLALTMRGGLNGRVEIEKTGPAMVAVKITTENELPAPEELGRIRDEIRRRGLKLSALSLSLRP
jgi:hypothetical protein